MDLPDFSRSAMLLGKDGIDKLKTKTVAVFGIGGVGSYTVEALVRSGIGRIILVDNDVVTESNLNRQLIATVSTIGRRKVDVAKERALSINPNIKVDCFNVFVLPDNTGDIPILECDYIVDAIDTVSAKLFLAEFAYKNNIPIISSMGTGNKLDPTRLTVCDIHKTTTCPLARVMRRELTKRGIARLKVVYSDEPPLTPDNSLNSDADAQGGKRQTPGSVSFVPPVAGMIAAGEAIKDMLGI